MSGRAILLGLCAAALSCVVARAEVVEGLVVPSARVTLAAPLDGIVEALPFEENQSVRAGDVVARMDDAIQRVEVLKATVRAESEAALVEAELIQQEMQIMLDRAEDAMDRNAASNWEVRRAKLQRDQAIASVHSTKDSMKLAEAELELQREILAQHELKAPFDGRVLRQLVEPGATLQRGGEMLVIVRLDPLEAEVFMPIEAYGDLQAGATYELTPDPSIRDEPLTATLKTIDPLIDSASRTFRCVFEIPNPDEALPAGFEVSFDLDQTDR
ncbi:MAG: efflux RND transporter periplasmic adaptor subunit [Planctomycetota bacterium]